MAERNRSAKLEKTLAFVQKEKDQIQIDLSSKVLALSRETTRERIFAIVLTVLSAALGLGVANGMPIIPRILCCGASYCISVWIAYSLSSWLRGVGMVRFLGAAIAFGICIAFLASGYIRNELKAEESSVTQGVLVPLIDPKASPVARNTVMVELGPTSTLERTNSTDSNQGLFKILDDMGINVRPGDNGPVLSTTVKDWNGNVVAEITDNHWRVIPRHCSDKNFDANSLEIKDDSGHVIFQARIFANKIQLKGEWHDQFGHGVRLGRTGIGQWDTYEKWRSLEPIAPIFKYPSESYLGEFIQQ
ncbi:MAG: hypothetical protein JST28_15470 [Acidobacteria bacterium]|nr:hypothetical protein [Acidobacteriota bacterium]